MHHRGMQFVITAGIVAVLCGSGLTSCSDSVGPPETGTLQMVLVDAPAQIEAVDSLKVVFKDVRVHRSSDSGTATGGWITVLPETLPVEARTFNLLELVNGVFATLGEVELEVGRYTQIRIALESATLFVDGVPQNLTIPSGFQSGIKLVGGFTIEPDLVTTVAADFDVARSLHEDPPGSGDYILRPTIRLMQTSLSGTISGIVTPTGIGAVLFALRPATGDTITTTLANPINGAYVLPALPAGSYDVRAEAPGYVTSTRSGVAVAAGADTPNIDFGLAPGGN